MFIPDLTSEHFDASSSSAQTSCPRAHYKGCVHHEGGCGIPAQGDASSWVVLDLMDYFFAGPQIPEGSTDFDAR
eukprot:12812321-Alexandrium_andersonii.AAC.1